VNGQSFCCDTKVLKSFDPGKNDNPELYQYYYHSDHLGSSSLITNLDGETVQHVEYVPFGEVFIEERNNTWNTPYLFNAKELDEETGLYYYGVRYYDPRISIFYGVDPLVEKTGTPYQYCYQNPIRFIDKKGRAPGDPFKTRIEAANDFAKYYNGTSISMKKEFASFIYKSLDGSYSYNIARIGEKTWSIPNFDIPEGATTAAGIHTHPAEDSESDPYNFSDADKTSADKVGVNEYVVTTGGHLFEYDVEAKSENKNVENAAKDIPSNPNASKRVNEIDAKDTKPYYIDVQYLSNPNRRVVYEYNKPENK
jgi:RHS repeat-associated protein